MIITLISYFRITYPILLGPQIKFPKWQEDCRENLKPFYALPTPKKIPETSPEELLKVLHPLNVKNVVEGSP